MLFEAVLVLAVIGFVVYGGVRVLDRVRYQQLPASTKGIWRATHYDSKGATLVVLQKTSPTGANLLSEHVVARIRLDDPEYDQLFMTAMAAARERRAMFETEED